MKNNIKEIQIGFDAISLPKHFSGAAHYIINLIRNILSSERRFNATIFCKPEHSILFLDLLNDKDAIVNVNFNNRLQMIYFYERHLKRLLIKNKIKLFHAMHYIVPPKSTYYKIINTVHDMGFMTYPRYYEIYRLIYFNLRMKTYLKRSEKIISVSKRTTNSILSKYPDFEKKIFTIYPGIDHLSPKISEQSKKNYILAVNTFEKRKNIPFLIDLYNYLSEKYNLDYDFIIVGQKANDFKNIIKKINKSKYSNRIEIKTNVSEKDLINLYREAQFFVNASEFEGFGFTSFEAVLQGCPAFIYTKAIPDNLISNTKYILPNLSLEKWATAIINERHLYFVNRSSAESIKDFTWQKSAKRIVKLYNENLKIGEKVIV